MYKQKQQPKLEHIKISPIGECYCVNSIVIKKQIKRKNLNRFK